MILILTPNIQEASPEYQLLIRYLDSLKDIDVARIPVKQKHPVAPEGLGHGRPVPQQDVEAGRQRAPDGLGIRQCCVFPAIDHGGTGRRPYMNKRTGTL